MSSEIAIQDQRRHRRPVRATRDRVRGGPFVWVVYDESAREASVVFERKTIEKGYEGIGRRLFIRFADHLLIGVFGDYGCACLARRPHEADFVALQELNFWVVEHRRGGGDREPAHDSVVRDLVDHALPMHCAANARDGVTDATLR